MRTNENEWERMRLDVTLPSSPNTWRKDVKSPARRKWTHQRNSSLERERRKPPPPRLSRGCSPRGLRPTAAQQHGRLRFESAPRPRLILRLPPYVPRGRGESKAEAIREEGAQLLHVADAARPLDDDVLDVVVAFVHRDLEKLLEGGLHVTVTQGWSCSGRAKGLREPFSKAVCVTVYTVRSPTRQSGRRVAPPSGDAGCLRGRAACGGEEGLSAANARPGGRPGWQGARPC